MKNDMGKAKQNAICKYKDICSQQIILKNISTIYLYIIYGQVAFNKTFKRCIVFELF